MLRFSSPPRSAIIKQDENPPGSAPERLQRQGNPDNSEKHELNAKMKRSGSSSSVESTVGYPDHYMKLPSGYRTVINGADSEPMLFQPKPLGLQLLIDDFAGKTGHRLEMLDQEHLPGNTVRDRFNAAKEKLDSVVLADGQPVAIIMSRGQQHAIPIMLQQHGVERWLIIFDSNSGGIAKQYYAVANTFPNCKVMLNRGTRQRDTQSCITDAFEVLCKAFDVDDLCAKIGAKADKEIMTPPVGRSPVGRERPRFSGAVLQQENFYLFGMPEELCFTAQRAEFIEQSAGADLHKKFRMGDTMTTLYRELLRHREVSQCELPGPGTSGMKIRHFGINNYLYVASRKHKAIIDSTLRRSEPQPESLLVKKGASSTGGLDAETSATGDTL